MCSSLVQLAPGSRDLSQAEKRITVMLYKAEQIPKMTTIFTRAQPVITSGSGCPGNFKCPDSGLPVFFLPGLRTFNTFKVQEKP